MNLLLRFHVFQLLTVSSRDGLMSSLSPGAEECEICKSSVAPGAGALPPGSPDRYHAAPGEAFVGDEYVPAYAIAKDALNVLWADMAAALYHKFAAV